MMTQPKDSESEPNHLKEPIFDLNALKKSGFSIKRMLHLLETRLISEALHEAKGCRAEAARLLKMNRTTLVMKIQSNYLISKVQ